MHVDRNKDEWVTLTAGGNDDAVRAIHSNDRAVLYKTTENRLTADRLLQILTLFNDDPNVLNTANIIPPAKPCGNDAYILEWL